MTEKQRRNMSKKQWKDCKRTANSNCSYAPSVVRVVALQTLGSLALRGDEDTMSVVSGYLQQADVEMRTAALEALASMAEKGDQGAILEVSSSLSDPSSVVRATALTTLAW